MDLKLNSKRAIVTGGSAGIGLAIARTLAAEGAEIIIPGHSGRKLKEAIVPLPGVAHAIETDLGTSEGAKRFIEQVPETDILVNNLGIYESKNFADISDEEWLRYFEVNLVGAFGWRDTTFPPCSKGTGDASSLFRAKPPPRLAATTNGAAIRCAGGILRALF
jgi:NAD(P)-dependent dehydrogenase (short-subunit alcohol dehydrogenase family)